MKAMRALALAGVAVLAALLVLRVAGPNASAAEGRVAPPFRLPIVWPESRRGLLTSQALRGHPVVLNFWASWCDPCRREAPLLAAVARTRSDVVVVGIDVHDFRRDARAFLRSRRPPYVALASPSERLIGAYDLTNLPETYYLDRDGRIVGRTVGQLTRRALRHGLALALRS